MHLTPLTAHTVLEGDEELEELSGLSIDPGRRLWTVSDRESALFRLDAEFKVDRRWPVNLPDLEGIAVGPGVVGVASEPGQFATYDLETGAKTGNKWDLRPWISGDPEKKGLEGACWAENAWVVITERPRKLLSVRDHVTVLANLENHAGFGDEDCSGIDWDKQRGVFWICSHEGSRVYTYDPMGDQEPWSTTLRDLDGNKLKQAEGVAVSGDRLIIACDKTARIYQYDINPG